MKTRKEKLNNVVPFLFEKTLIIIGYIILVILMLFLFILTTIYYPFYWFAYNGQLDFPGLLGYVTNPVFVFIDNLDF